MPTDDPFGILPVLTSVGLGQDEVMSFPEVQALLANLNRAKQLNVAQGSIDPVLQSARQTIQSDFPRANVQEPFGGGRSALRQALGIISSRLNDPISIADQQQRQQAQIEAQRQQEQQQFQQQRSTQLEALKRFREQSLAQREGSRQQVLSAIPQIEQQFGQSLLSQEQNALNNTIRPLIENRLAQLGILQSGALPEALAKATGNLEQARQARIADFDLGARNLANIQLPLQNTESDIGLGLGAQQSDIDLSLSQLQSSLGLGRQNVFGGIDLARAGLQRQFGLEDLAQEEDFQRQMQRSALEAALANRRRGTSGIGQFAGTAGGALIGGFFGGLPGAQFGSQLGGQFGNAFEDFA